ncbi:hypothetical protein G9A89_009753 [Geosiphon pyriformis]|nr:hypothetical protein G9A89_009753 [Geosiphon pyriformis]
MPKKRRKHLPLVQVIVYMVTICQTKISHNPVWIDPKIIKTQVDVAIKKSFTLDINLSAVEGKLATAKTHVIRKLFSRINGFGGTTTLSKFEEIIRSMFTSEESMKIAASLAGENGIIVNTNLKRQGVCSDRAVVIKKIPMNTPKEMIIATVSEYGQIVSIKVQLIGLVRCAVVCFENDEDLEFAFHTKPVFGGVKLSWARLDLVQCKQCGKLGHSVLECDAEISHSPKLSKSFKKVVSNVNCLQLAKLYAKNPHFGSGLGFGSSPGATGLVDHSSLAGPVGSILETRLASLECSLELLTDKVSGIINKLDSLSLVPLDLASFSQPLVASGSVNMKFGLDMVLDEPDSVVIPPSSVSSGASSLGSSSSKILTLKVDCLELKLVALEALVCSLMWKIATYNVKRMNNSAKQEDIIRWHRDMNNLVSIVTETKLKNKVRPWIASKFDGVRVFISGLNSGHLGSGVAIVINNSLAKHVCKVSKILGRLISVKLLFRNKLLVSILGLYTGASASVCFSQTDDMNALIASAVNESSFVVLGGNFNEDGLHRSTSFRKCGSLGLVNSLVGSPFVKVLTWSNSRDVTKTIDYLFVSPNLVNAIVDRDVLDVSNFFDTDHQAISALIGLGGLLDTHLCSVRKQTNRDCWKYNFKNASVALWLRFREATAVNAAMLSDDFLAARELLDLDVMFHKLELLVSKLVRASHFVDCDVFVSLLDTWELLDSTGAAVVRSLFLSKSPFDNICSALSKARKFYRASKLSESRHAEDSQIRSVIDKRMESFESDKGHTIKSVLERPFCKVVLNHLVIGNELYLEPDHVKKKVDEIMEGWTHKHKVVLDIAEYWSHQYWPLNYVFDGAFLDVISCVSFDEMSGVVSDLPDGKAAGLSGISNELWKHCDKSVLDMLLVLFNYCLCEKFVSSAWKEAWVSMIPKSYEWKGMLTNIHSIALIETA